MAVTRKMIMDYMQVTLGARSVVVLDEFETCNARHICRGTTQIKLLPREFMKVVLPDGYSYIDVDYYFCRSCGKLFLNKNSITLVGGEQVVRPVPVSMGGGSFGMANAMVQNGYRPAIYDVNPNFGNGYMQSPLGNVNVENFLLNQEPMQGGYNDASMQPFQGVMDEGIGFDRGDEESPWDFDINPDSWY